MKPKVAATLPWSRSGRDLAADVRWELRHQLNTVASYAQWTLVPVVLLAIDDFGTGYANIGQLLDLPADIVKLDKRFIRQLPAAGQGGTLVLAIIGMAQGMGKTTIAEGVENREQLDFLRSAGCTAYQGFLAGAALPEREACELARGWRGH